MSLPSDWEQKVDTILQLNNDRFLEQESLNVDVASFQLPVCIHFFATLCHFARDARLIQRLQHSIGRISRISSKLSSGWVSQCTMHNHAIMLLCNVLSAGVSDVLTGVTTDSEMDPHTRISTGAALGRISEASALFWNTGAEISFYSY